MAQGPGTGPDPDVFGAFKKFRGPQHVEAGAHQLLNIAEIPGDVVRDAATAVGDVFALIHHGDFEVGAEAFQAAGHLGPRATAPMMMTRLGFHAFSSEWLRFGCFWCAGRILRKLVQIIHAGAQGADASTPLG